MTSSHQYFNRLRLRQQPSNVPIQVNTSNVAGSNPIAHHHLSLIAAQRMAIGDARLARRMAQEGNVNADPQTDVKV